MLAEYFVQLSQSIRNSTENGFDVRLKYLCVLINPFAVFQMVWEKTFRRLENRLSHACKGWVYLEISGKYFDKTLLLDEAKRNFDVRNFLQFLNNFKHAFQILDSEVSLCRIF